MFQQKARIHEEKALRIYFRNLEAVRVIMAQGIS